MARILRRRTVDRFGATVNRVYDVKTNGTVLRFVVYGSVPPKAIAEKRAATKAIIERAIKGGG